MFTYFIYYSLDSALLSTFDYTLLYALEEIYFFYSFFYYSSGSGLSAYSKSFDNLFDAAVVFVAALGGTTGVPSINDREVGFKNIP